MFPDNTIFPLRSYRKFSIIAFALWGTDVFRTNSQKLTLLSTSLQLICDWTMYMSESTNPEHSLSFLLASLRSELTFLREKRQATN